MENVHIASLIRTEQFIEIGIVGTKVVTEVCLPADLTYFNYAAFSHDNRYFGCVGKPTFNGLIQIFKINFNAGKGELSIGDAYLSRLPNYASWVCGFSKQGYFATYDSTPDTYLIHVDDDLFGKDYTDTILREKIAARTSTIYGGYKRWKLVKGKNFLCFSPTGNFTALSEQGYEPFTLGGYGHQESSALHIAATASGVIVKSFLEHGDEIKDDMSKKLAFVAFSEDEKKIMSLSKDGVVIVRTINLTFASDIQMATKNSITELSNTYLSAT
ncbi:MAG: hypothetical protein EOP48_31010 [Sphingobacteriales bacterium]|nr:MAG: hypothetical protein EOP48_31010 [Sphingobacteriales bacterium]